MYIDIPKATGESNTMKALRRVMTPRSDGSFLVPLEFVEKFKDLHGGGRAELINMWDKCSHDKDYITLSFTCNKRNLDLYL